jgi:23S rRNA pseudouridine2605 synthase
MLKNKTAIASGFPMNLSKFVASCGLASRRKSSTMVIDGLIKVNGKTVSQPGFKVSESDEVMYGKRKLELSRYVYVMLNKPRGYICSNADPNAPRKAVDLIKTPGLRLFSAGRLDKDSEGMIIFTNNGAYSEKLTHPKYGIIKTYRVTVNVPLSAVEIKELESGIRDEGELLKALSIKRWKNSGVYIFKLNEGKKREIRRMIGYTGKKTTRLERTAIGGLVMKNLPQGKWRFINKDEIALSLGN